MMVAIFECIDRLFRIVRPRKLLYMAIDGVAPRAKMNQQRSRRFRASKETVEKIQEIARVRKEMSARGLILPPEKAKEAHFDSNCITPGTPFMARLSNCLHYYIHDRLNNDPGWRNIKVILSDANVPGEGEHKIMDYIRRQRAQPDHDPNTQHCLCGADADLIMLGLATHEPNFTIIREEFKPNKPKTCDICGQEGHEMKDCIGLTNEVSDPGKPITMGEEQQFIFVRLNVLREYLERELEMPGLPFEYDFERAVDDWVFMCFFVGNDFLPHLPSLEIREGAIDRLVNLYKKTVTKTGGFITDSGNVTLDRVQLIMTDLGDVEDEIFKNRQQTELMFKQRDKMRKRREKQQNMRHNFQGPWAPQPVGQNVGPMYQPRQEAYHQRVQHMHSQSAAGSYNSPPNQSNRGQKRTHDDVDEGSEEEEGVNDEVRLWESGFKDRYYESKFDVGSDNLAFRYKVALEYVKGLCWVLKYYYQELNGAVLEPRPVESEELNDVVLEPHPVELEELNGVMLEPRPVELEELDDAMLEPRPLELEKLEELNCVMLESRPVELEELNGAMLEPRPVELEELNGAMLEPRPVELEELNDAVLEPRPVELEELNGAMLEPQPVELGELNDAVLEPRPVELEELNGAMLEPRPVELEELNGAMLEPRPVELEELNGAMLEPRPVELEELNDAVLEPRPVELEELNGAMLEPRPVELGELNDAVLEPRPVELEELNGAVLEPRPVELEELNDAVLEPRPVELEELNGAMLEPRPLELETLEELNGVMLEPQPVALEELNGAMLEPRPVELEELNGVTLEPRPVALEELNGVMLEPRPVELEELNGVMLEPRPVALEELNGVMLEPQPVALEELNGAMLEPRPVELEELNGVTLEPRPVALEELNGVMLEPRPVELEELNGVTLEQRLGARSAHSRSRIEITSRRSGETKLNVFCMEGGRGSLSRVTWHGSFNNCITTRRPYMYTCLSVLVVIGLSELLNTEVVPASSPILVNVPALDQLTLESAVQSNLKDLEKDKVNNSSFLKEFLHGYTSLESSSSRRTSSTTTAAQSSGSYCRKQKCRFHLAQRRSGHSRAQWPGGLRLNEGSASRPRAALPRHDGPVKKDAIVSYSRGAQKPGSVLWFGRDGRIYS
ncbi:5'-3' exoribonuclease 2 [Homalodisca vitripennis]|nr:5'-3' exoribonuclease 2 [Homalodisca vitripennis]